MNDLTWVLLTDPICQMQQILDVFLRAFLPQGRETEKRLSDYFYAKIKPRFEKKQRTIVVQDHDKMVGFVIFEKWGDQTYYLAEMAVLPEYQGQGLGKKLVFSIFDQDQTAQKIVLVTEKANKWSQAFYEKIGFKSSSFQHPDYPENFPGYKFCR